MMKYLQLRAVFYNLTICGPLFQDFDPLQTPPWMMEVPRDSFILPPVLGSTHWLVCLPKGWVVGELVVNHGVVPARWGYYPLPQREKLESWYLEEEWQALAEGAWGNDVRELGFYYPPEEEEDDGLVQESTPETASGHSATGPPQGVGGLPVHGPDRTV